MKVVFRLDAYSKVGFGHLIRTTAIAKATAARLGGRGQVKIVGFFDAYAQSYMQNEGVPFASDPSFQEGEASLVHWLKEEQADLLFVDRLYPYSEEQVLEYKQYARVVFFHSLCEGGYLADAFILPTAHTAPEIVESPKWQANGVRFYHGFDYVPVSEKLKALRESRKEVLPSMQPFKVGLATGGSDPQKIATRFLSGIGELGRPYDQMTFYKGGAFVAAEELTALQAAAQPLFQVEEFDIRKMAADCSVILLAFGVTAYELTYLGVPFISFGHADSTAEASDRFAKRNQISDSLGLYTEKANAEIIELLGQRRGQGQLLVERAQAGMDLMDGKGVDRIVDILIED